MGMAARLGVLENALQDHVKAINDLSKHDRVLLSEIGKVSVGLDTLNETLETHRDEVDRYKRDVESLIF